MTKWERPAFVCEGVDLAAIERLSWLADVSDESLAILIDGVTRDLDEGTAKDHEAAVALVTQLAAESYTRYEAVQAQRTRPRHVGFQVTFRFGGLHDVEVDAHKLHELTEAYIRERLEESVVGAPADNSRIVIQCGGTVHFTPTAKGITP